MCYIFSPLRPGRGSQNSTPPRYPDVKQRFADLGMSLGGTPSELDIYIKSEIEKWSKVIKDTDIRALD